MILGKQPRLSIVLLASILAMLLIMYGTGTARADDVEIKDQASVLDTAKVQSEATKLYRPLIIYTVPSFPDGEASYIGLENAFDQDVENHLDQLGYTATDKANGIAIGIDVKDRYISIKSGDNVQLSNDDASKSIKTFGSNLNGNNYTAALVKMLQFLQQTIAANENARTWDGVMNALKCLGIVALIAVVAVLSYIFRGSSGYRYRSSYSSGYHSSSSSSSSSSNSGGSTGGGAGGHF
ncbi:MAG: TPM domain-containing protein [Ktedonobacteraceae bacterium]|nr:TPM domain-containing protein [Ktedonobacteraceae bacterium]